jgi:hypothetical protein
LDPENLGVEDRRRGCGWNTSKDTLKSAFWGANLGRSSSLHTIGDSSGKHLSSPSRLGSATNACCAFASHSILILSAYKIVFLIRFTALLF